MKKISHPLLVFAGFLFLVVSPASSMNLLLPPDNSYVDFGRIHIVMENDGRIDSYQVNVNNFGYPQEDVPKNKQKFYAVIYLSSGENEIKVTGFKEGKNVSTQTINIFYREGLSTQNYKEPKDSTQYLFHSPQYEKLCTECHRLEFTAKDGSPDSPEDSPCYVCHKGKLEVKYVHDPAGTWTCFECHAPSKDGMKLVETETVRDLCYNCHDSNIDGWKEQKYMHGPTAVGQCVLCHDPHGSDWPGFARLHATDLCARCHTDKESGRHVIASFSGKGHPTRGVPDPRDPSREFTCAGCHNPHGAETTSFLNFPRTGGSMLFCQYCHKDK